MNSKHKPVPIRSYFTLAAILAFLSVFLLWPLAHVVHKAFVDNRGFTLVYIRDLLSNPLQLEALGTSLLIALFVTLSCTAIALPMSWVVSRREFAGKTALSGLMLLPLITPPFVGSVGMKMLFSRSGALSALLMRLGIADHPVDWLGSYPLLGVIILETLHLFPILYLNLVASISNIDPSLEEAAANLGAGPWQVFRRVTLPLAGPGFFAGAMLIFVWSFTELGTPLIFGLRRVLPVLIYDSVSEVGTNPMGYAQVFMVLAVSGLGFWISKRAAGRQDTSTLGRLTVTRKETRLSPMGTLLTYLFIGTILFIAVLPHLTVMIVATTQRWFLTILPQGFTLEFFRRALGSDMTQTALTNSLILSLCASLLDIVIGFAIAWLCVRQKIRGADGLDALAMLPIAVPGLVIAFGYLGCFSGKLPDSLAQFFDPRINPMPLLAVSYSIRRLPYMVRAAHAGLQQTSHSYEEAAANLGATPLRVIRRITFPLISANLIAGGILCFAFSMLEVSDSLVLAQSEQFYPITKAIYVLTEGLDNGPNVAAALGFWAMALLAAALLWASCLLGKRMGQMFRVG